MMRKTFSMILVLTMVFTSVDITAFAQQKDDTEYVSMMEGEVQEMAETPEPTEKSAEPTVKPTAEGEDIEPAEMPTVVPTTLPKEQETMSPEVTPESEKTVTPEIGAIETPEETTIPEMIPEESATPSSTPITGAEMEDLVSTVTASGQCGDNLIWTLEGGTLTISGTGDMWDYRYFRNRPWTEYSDIVTNLVLEDGITSIGDYAFYECNHLISNLKLPKSLEVIGDGAFFDCSNLRGDLIIPIGVKRIGKGAFYNCKMFSGELKLPNTLEYIGASAFYSCSGFTGDLMIPSSVVEIGGSEDSGYPCDIYSGAFGECSGFNGELVISSKLINIGNDTFSNCSGFTGNLDIPTSVENIGCRAFSGCSGFTGDLIIPDSVVSIKAGAFEGCTGFLGNLVLGKSIEVIGGSNSTNEGAFEGCEGFSGDLIIPNSVTAINGCAFYNCKGFDGKLVIGENVGTIEWRAFAGCNGFTGDLVIPDSVTLIGGTSSYSDGGAFSGCSGFDGKLIIGDGLVTIEDGAFSGCCNVSGDLTLGKSVTNIGNSAFSGCHSLTGELKIPQSVKIIGAGAFRGCSGFKGDLVIPDNVTSLGESAFVGCSGFDGDLIIGNGVDAIKINTFSRCNGFKGNLVIGNNVLIIEEEAFRECDGFKGTLTIGNSVEEICDRAFYQCSGFTGDLIIPDSVKILGDDSYSYNNEKGVFYGCSGFDGKLELSKNLTEIENFTFSGCSGLTGDLIIPSNIISIRAAETGVQSSGAFYNCSGLNGRLIIKNGIQTIGKYAFYGCSSFTGDLVIPNSVEIIEEGAFYGCTSFDGDLIIGDGVKEIQGSLNYCDGAFEGCSGFAGNIILGKNLKIIGPYSFLGCSKLTGALTIPQNVTSIGQGAFSGCSGLTGNLIIPESVTSIEATTFYGCSGFTGDLAIPKSVTSIGQSAFSGCSGLTGNLRLPESMTRIEYGTFSGCSSFTGNLVISENVTYIGSLAFSSMNVDNIIFQGDAPNINQNSLKNIITKAYYPSWKIGWNSIIDGGYGGSITWIPYEEGSTPWEMNTSSSAPIMWFVFSAMPEELVWSEETKYNNESIDLDISILCMLGLNDEILTYENVTVELTLSKGISFSESEEVTTITQNLGTMSLSGTKRQDMSFTVYIDETIIKEEFSVDVKLTADGYETPQENTYKIPVSIVLEKPTEIDETIINTVERYTSDKEVQEVLEIFSNSSSDEELRQRLFEYYNYDNMLDVRERIIELGDMHDERWDYEGLIRDDMYLSWQYYNYLNNTPKGAAARVALYASGLVFNGEINDWIDPSTYLDSELPGIKKYKSMLEEFIQTQSSTIENYSYVKEAESFLNSTVGIWSATEKADIIKKLKEAPDGKSCKSYFNNFVAMKIGSGKDSMTLIFDGEKPKFMEAMNITDTVFDVVNISLDGITGLVDVSSNLETYETYHGFLKEIYEADDLPWELVVAAYQLDQELGQAYWTPIKGILDEIRDKCLGEAFDAAGFENLLNKNGWLSAINFSAFCINQFVDIGAMVVNSCHTEGYAFLAMHYRNKLEQCKQQFIANKTEENAWAFYEAYVMLWKLRAAGEKKFLQMSKLEGNKVIDGLYEATEGETLGGMISELCGYSDKEAAVNDNLKMLEGFAFKYSIKNENLPDEYKYLQKIVIECPVSVEILTSDGTQVCVLNDGVETEITNEHGTFVSFYRATTGDYAKIAYFNSDAPYVIRAIGQDTGEVTYSFARTEDHQTYTVAGFDKVNISEKDIINITTNEEKYIVDEGGDGTDDIEGEQADKSKIFVQFDYQDGKQIRVTYADTNGMITLPEVPAREGYEFKGWFEDSAGLENEFTGDTIVSKSITVYAKWESKEVKVLSTPTANIVSGSAVEKGTEITLTCSEEGAHIFYTLDGTMPTEESAEYDSPIIVDKEITIKAIAVKEGYQNSEVATFTYMVEENTAENQGDILPEDIPSDGIIPDGIWLAGISDKTYTGTGIIQSFRVYDDKKLLKEKTDYTITYKNNKNAYTYTDEDYAAFEENLQATGKRVKTGTFDPAKAPQATIRMKGNYSGSQTIYFKIEPADITGEEFAAGDLAVTWNGKKQTPAPTLTWNGRKLKYGTDFHIPEYDNAKNDKSAFTAQGTYDLTITGKGNFTGEIPVTLTISEGAKQIAMDKVTVKGIKNLSWTGGQLMQTGFTAGYKNDVLSEENGDYTVSWGTNTDVGTGTLTLTGTGLDQDGDGYSYIGTKTVSFKITGTPMSRVTVEGLKKEYVYTGDAIRPEITLAYKADKNAAPVPLEEGTHYTVSYEKNTEKGTAAVIFTGLAGGGYTGTKKVTFRIVSSGIADKKEGENLIEQVSVTFKDTENLQNGIYTAPYMKGGAKPEVIVTSGEKTLIPGKDYTVSYANNKKTALSTDAKAPSLTVKGRGNYTGSKTVYFSIEAKPLSNENGITIAVKDKVESTKKNGYRQSFKVYDADGTALGSSDYDSKNVIYMLIRTENADGTVSTVNEVLDKDSVVPANSVISITVQGKGVYAGGTATGTYRILENSHDISKATIQISDQSYTGKPVRITEQSQFKTGKVFIRIGKETKVLTLGEDIEVVPDSYVKNVNKGTAKVTFRGINDFGGTKTVSFRIGTRSISDFWKGIYTKVENLFG